MGMDIHSTLENVQTNRTIKIPVVGAASSSSIEQQDQRRAEFILFDVSKNDTSWDIKSHSYTLNIAQKRVHSNQSNGT